MEAHRNSLLRARYSLGHIDRKPPDVVNKFGDLDRLQREWFDDRSPLDGLVNLGVNLRGMVQSDARVFHAEMQDMLTRKMPVCIQVSNITEVSGPTQWKPGQSGNLNGRPVGTRQAFSAGFYRDLAEVFAKHGRAAMEKTAIDQPSVFFGICARLLPAETRLTIEAGLPGGLDPGDWALLREVIEAVRSGIPDAAHSNACYRRLGRLMPSC